MEPADNGFDIGSLLSFMEKRSCVTWSEVTREFGRDGDMALRRLYLLKRIRFIYKPYARAVFWYVTVDDKRKDFNPFNERRKARQLHPEVWPEEGPRLKREPSERKQSRYHRIALDQQEKLEAVLYKYKESGLTVGQLVAGLEWGRNTVMKHLYTLLAEGRAVKRIPSVKSVGRPAYLWFPVLDDVVEEQVERKVWSWDDDPDAVELGP